MDPELRTTICRLIAGLVVSDDDLSPEEDKFLERVLESFEISDRSQIFPIVDRSEAGASMRALPEAVREQALTLMLEAAAADGKVVDDERRYLHAVGDAMGIPAPVVDARLEAALAPRR